MHRTTITLPEDLDRRLTEAARRRGSTRTEVLRQALRHELDAEIHPRPRSVGLGRRPDAGVSSETIKDAVRRDWLDRLPG